jgi:uncharacterized membrane protein (DUF485 family)
MIEQDKLEKLTENLNKYVKTNFELVKLEATERACVVGSKLIVSLILLVIFCLFILFISLGASFYLSDYFNNNSIGFVIVAGFYLFIGLILVTGKKTFLEKPLCNKIIRKVFSNN